MDHTVTRPVLKRLETGWKEIWLRLFCAVLAGRPPRGTPDWRDGPRRVLFLRPDRIGDAIVSTGLLRALASLSPQLRIDVLASPANAEVVRRFPWVDHVHVFDKRRPSSFPGLLRRLRAARYDCAIDCMVTSPSMTGLLLMLASGATHRVGVAGRGVDAALTLAVPKTPGGVHIIDLLFALGGAFGIAEEADRRPELAVSDTERDWAEAAWCQAGRAESSATLLRRLLVNVSAGRASRAWPDDRFLALLGEVHERCPDVRTLLMGAPGEWERVAGIAALAGARAVATPQLGQAIALVATADCIFTPDTSIAHMASAFGKPAVAMYLNGAAAQWGLFQVNGTILESPDQTLSSIPVEAAVAALLPLLGSEYASREDTGSSSPAGPQSLRESSGVPSATKAPLPLPIPIR